MIGILTTIPLLISIVSFIWSNSFNDEDKAPISKKGHISLIIFQLLTITFFYTSFSDYSKFSLITLYIVQAIGVTYLLFKKGNVPCGCFGPQFNTKLQPKLIFYNITLSILSFLSLYENIHFELYQGLLLELFMSLLVLVLTVGIPDALYAIKGYRKIAIKYQEYL